MGKPPTQISSRSLHVILLRVHWSNSPPSPMRARIGNTRELKSRTNHKPNNNSWRVWRPYTPPSRARFNQHMVAYDIHKRAIVG